MNEQMSEDGRKRASSQDNTEQRIRCKHRKESLEWLDQRL